MIYMFAKVVFFLSATLFLYAYVGYPLVLFVLGLFFRQREGGRDLVESRQDNSNLPTVTVLICAYNEEDIIEKKLQSVLASEYPKSKLQVLVASESSDSTDTIVRRYEKQGVELLSFQPREGKQPSIYKAWPYARGEVVVLTDANALLEPNAIRALAVRFSDANIGCVSGQLHYLQGRGSGAVAEEGTYWQYEEMVKHLESRLGSLIGANGALYALRQSLYFPLSRFRGDDFELPIGVLLEGKKSILERSAKAYEYVPQNAQSLYKQKTRIISWVWKSACVLCWRSVQRHKWLVLFQIVSHKISRWLVPIYMVCMVVSIFVLANVSITFMLLFILQVCFYFIAAVGAIMLVRGKQKLPKPLRLSAYFVVINTAALSALWQALTGSVTNTWEKVDR